MPLYLLCPIKIKDKVVSSKGKGKGKGKGKVFRVLNSLSITP
jgi:hypothetical protein